LIIFLKQSDISYSKSNTLTLFLTIKGLQQGVSVAEKQHTETCGKVNAGIHTATSGVNAHAKNRAASDYTARDANGKDKLTDGISTSREADDKT
jgi:hypothetical protein